MYKSLSKVYELVSILFEHNEIEASKWMYEPNALLFGRSPFEVCITNEQGPLINWLNDRLGR